MSVDLPSLTATYDHAADFRPDNASVYICGHSIEERSAHQDAWSKSVPPTGVIKVSLENRFDITLVNAKGLECRISLRSMKQLRHFWTSVLSEHIYIDITGLRHGTWAGLLRGLTGTTKRVSVVYVEPVDYRMSVQPTENEIYDLSERIEGLAPIPGFASLRREGPTGCFVPLLGFEGTRLQYLINKLEPPGQKLFPIIGVPGFRAEYPFVTFLANRTSLVDTQGWKKVRFAAAECPFDVINLLSQLHHEHPTDLITVAPIGTKPHALGAVLAALKHPDYIELAYDHPVRKAKRTLGTSRLHVYQIGWLLA